jgi:hypothetical protein
MRQQSYFVTFLNGYSIYQRGDTYQSTIHICHDRRFSWKAGDLSNTSRVEKCPTGHRPTTSSTDLNRALQPPTNPSHPFPVLQAALSMMCGDVVMVEE